MSDIDDFKRLPDQAFVRLPIVLKLYGCSAATIWRGVKTKRIPSPTKLSMRITAWNVGELRKALSNAQNEK